MDRLIPPIIAIIIIIRIIIMHGEKTKNQSLEYNILFLRHPMCSLLHSIRTILIGSLNGV